MFYKILAIEENVVFNKKSRKNVKLKVIFNFFTIDIAY